MNGRVNVLGYVGECIDMKVWEEELGRTKTSTFRAKCIGFVAEIYLKWIKGVMV